MIIGVGGWRGIGATTTALAAAGAIASLGPQPWLVEADPAGGVLAARLHAAAAGAGGLERVAFPSARASSAERFADAAVEVGGVRCVLGAGDPFRAASCHRPRVPWASALRELEAPVVVDLGRLRSSSPQAALLERLDVLLLVTNPDTVSVAATLEWAAARGRVSADTDPLPFDITRVVVVDAPVVDERASRLEVETELGDRFAGWIPWSPAGVALIQRGAAHSDRRLRRDPLARASHQLADRVCSLLAMERSA